jgi:hypothetical protein
MHLRQVWQQSSFVDIREISGNHFILHSFSKTINLMDIYIKVLATKKPQQKLSGLNKYGSYLLSRIVVQYHRP